MVKITHLGKYYAPESGGIESATRILAEGTANFGYQVDIVCFTKSVDLPSLQNFHNIRVIRSKSFLSIMSQPLSLEYIFNAIKFTREANIVHIHLPNMLAAFASLFIPSSKILVHWHSDVIGKGILGVLLKKLENLCLIRASKIVATSEIYAEASNQLSRYIKKVHFIPLGCKDNSNNRINHTVSSLPEELDYFLMDKNLILSVGRLVPYKGFDVLIEAAQFLDLDSVVVIVGEGPLFGELNEKIKSLNLSHRIKLVGKQGDRQLDELFNRAKLFCLPSIDKSEAFGLVLVEAMSFGLPIVATNIVGSGVSWVNQHEVTGINVEVNNPEAIAIACNEIMNSEVRYKFFQSGSRLRYLAEFTDKLQIDRTLKLYDSMV